MRAVKKFEAPEFYEGNIAAGEFHFERAAMMGRAEQHGLLLEGGADLTIFQHTLSDVVGLVRLVANAHELWPLRRFAFRPEILGETLGRETDHSVGGSKDRLCRTIIAVERNDLSPRTEGVGKVENVAHGGRAKRIDRLCV